MANRGTLTTPAELLRNMGSKDSPRISKPSNIMSRMGLADLECSGSRRRLPSGPKIVIESKERSDSGFLASSPARSVLVASMKLNNIKKERCQYLRCEIDKNKRDFRGKTHGAPRLIPAFNHTRSLGSVALLERVAHYYSDPGFRPAVAGLHPGLRSITPSACSHVLLPKMP